MARIRILGPRPQLAPLLEELQRIGIVHLVSSRAAPDLRPVTPPAKLDEEERRLRRTLEDAAWLLEGLPTGPGDGRSARDFGNSGRLAGRLPHLRRWLERAISEERALEEERTGLERFQELFRTFERVTRGREGRSSLRAFYLLFREGESRAIEELRRGLSSLLDDDFEILDAPPTGGERPVALLVPEGSADRVESLLAAASLQELPVPRGLRAVTLEEAGPTATDRLASIGRRLEELRRLRRECAARYGGPIRRLLEAGRDRLIRLEARRQVSETDLAFVLEGWVPAAASGRLESRLGKRFGSAVVVERLGTEGWAGEDAPVVLTNPRLFRPFEAITRMLPLPRYGSIDPTPFVAVFFPTFFGVIVGDVGYGILLAVAALVLRRRSEPGSRLRAVSEIAGACAAFTVVFGLLYGEMFGDLGRRWPGLRPLILDREEALVPFLALALALGLVQVVLGLVLGAVASLRRHPREAVGHGVSAVMVLLVAIALLAAVEILPAGFFTPAVVGILVGFPALVIAEGLLAPLELLSTLGNVLSYARIMALGTASVMLAVVANRLAGTMGSVMVGVLFGLLFHLVNFALAIVGPTIHGLRLHYVEFFGKFFSPGGTEYRPYGKWRPAGPDRRAPGSG